MERPEAATLYVQLVYDFLVGTPEWLGSAAYGRLMGVSPKTVSRYLTLLESWGVVKRTGSSRKPGVQLNVFPNRQFCVDVVDAFYGPEALEDVAKGNRAPDLCGFTSDHGDHVCDYAVFALLAHFGGRGFYVTHFPEPNEATGTGYVRAVDWGQTSSTYVKGVVSKEQPSLCLSTRGLSVIAEYPAVLPEGCRIPAWDMTKSQRQARTRKLSAEYNSFAFEHFSLVKIQDSDTEYYQVVLALVEYWNGLSKLGERLNPKLYARLRNLLVEEAIPAEDLKRAMRAAQSDKWWRDKNLYTVCNNPSNVRTLVKQITHDRNGLGFSPIPDHANVVAVEF